MILWLWRVVVGRTGGRRTQDVAEDTRYSKAARDRRYIFVYDIIVCMVLAVLAWAYHSPAVMLKSLIPTDLQGTPIYAVWFGALGGIVISLKGVYDYSPREWQYKFNLWHLGRPFSGGIAGGVILLLLGTVSGGDLTWQVALAAAFVIGTQDRRFFNFLSEVARLIVQVPGDPQDADLNVSEILPQQGPRGANLRILGTGFDTGATVWVGTSKLENVVVSRDGTTITGTMPAGSGPTRIWIENPNGAARVISTLFSYQEDVDPPSLSFGDQEVGKPRDLTVKRLNRLSEPFTITNVTVTGPNEADFTVKGQAWLDKLIAPNGEQPIEVTYQPHAVGPSTATLAITSGAVTREVPLTGTGTAPSGNGAGGAGGTPNPPSSTPSGDSGGAVPSQSPANPADVSDPTTTPPPPA